MAAALYEQAFLIGSLHIASANAGKYDGTGSAVLATGTAAPGGYITEIHITATDSVGAGAELRFFLNDSSTKKLLPYTVNPPKYTKIAGERGTWGYIFRCYVPLKSASYTLEVNSETTDPFDIVAYGKSYV